MRTKSERIFYILTLAGLLSPFLVLAVSRYSLGIVSLLGLLVLTAVFGYAAYWGYSVRRGLMAPLYRRQAFWVASTGAFFSLQWLLIAALDPFYPYGPAGMPRYILDVYNDFGYVLVVAWITFTIPISRLSDPRLKDALRWSRLRPVNWVLVLLTPIGTAFGIEDFSRIGIVTSSTAYVAVLVGGLALGLSIKSSRDRMLRRHLKMFSIGVGLVIGPLLFGHAAHGLALLPASAGLLVQAVQYILLVTAGIYLYRSAKDLSPMLRVPTQNSSQSRVAQSTESS